MRKLKFRSVERFFLSLICLFFVVSVDAQDNGIQKQDALILKGSLLNKNTKQPLPYANVVVKRTNKGTITNEEGYFSLPISVEEEKDSLSFHYVGYKEFSIAIADFKLNDTIYLLEEIFSLNETFVFANDFKIKDILKQVVNNIEKNYKPINSKNEVFIREKFNSDIVNIDIKFKKSSFEALNKKMTKLVEQKIPKHSTSYSDILTNIYQSENKKDSIKLSPIKVVSLKDKNLADANQLEAMFEKMFKNTKEKEYWKIKSGIIGGKVDLGEDNSTEKLDSLKDFYKNNMHLYYYSMRLNRKLNNLMLDKKKWAFLYKPSNYNYQLVSGTRINNEDVYIIDFTPKNGGKFIGRMFIAMDTYAVVKADYKYDTDKHGTNVQLFGVGYTENKFETAIYFEKIEGNYLLKYYSSSNGSVVSFDRNLSLIKKKKRFLFDKKLNEIKVRLVLKAKEESITEILVLDRKKISNTSYKNYKQPQTFKVIHVDQFSDKLWKGHTIIEPTKQMKEYKKIN